MIAVVFSASSCGKRVMQASRSKNLGLGAESPGDEHWTYLQGAVCRRGLWGISNIGQSQSEHFVGGGHGAN